MKNFEEWKTEIETYISKLRLKGKTYAYYPSAEMLQPTANQLKDYFDNLNYATNFKKCNQCTNKYDLIFEWTL